jgi:acyl-CoA thioester hydrolase
VTDDDRAVYRTRWRVRVYELDANGHVNNAVFLNYAEHVATEHAEVLGLGRDWSSAQGATWVVHRHEIVFRRPAGYGDELEVSTRVASLKGARGVRRTSIVRVADQQSIAEITTEWAWVRVADGRPIRLPPQAIALFSELGALAFDRAG